ncbi:hypothetical protein CsSME_00018132 [Camellia sinensis var. sinensis]
MTCTHTILNLTIRLAPSQNPEPDTISNTTLCVALTSSPSAMEASIFPAVLVPPSSSATTTTTTTMTVVHGGGRVTDHSKPVINLISRNRNNGSIKTHRFKTPTTAVAAINDVLAAADPDQVAVSWQIVVGALACVTPFVVAGIEFSKRIVAQRKCGVCGGSGLVLRDKYYFCCPGCGMIFSIAPETSFILEC